MTDPIRLGVIGLGMMGRHHSRIAASLDGVDFVGGVDPGGDRHRAMAGRPVFGQLEEILDLGLDAAVVAVPSGAHASVSLALADAGIHALVEKPLAGTLEDAVAIRNAFARTDLIAAVGHVERCNAAMQDLKRRLDNEELGDIISISARRVGPHPDRVSDVGVVRDLATHDIDLALWLGGKFETIAAEISHRLGNPHEDLLEVVGRLESGAVVSLSVNWLTPTKERSVTVLGERGALVADLLSADLTFFANADVPMEWETMAQFKGVSEGDMIRYALPKPEPLRVQLEQFRDDIVDPGERRTVTLEDGVEVIRTTERILRDGQE